MGIGAAALHLPTSTVSPANLGDPRFHTVYEAELVGIRMAADLSLLHRNESQHSFWFFIDNQALVRALSQALQPSPGLALRQRAVDRFRSLLNLSPSTTISLVWCPAHVGIPENEAVDEAAKAATLVGSPQRLPTSLSAVKQVINTCCKASVTAEPPPNILRRLRGTSTPLQTKKALMALPRHAATAIAQLRAGHTPLSAFLHRIGAVEDPNCSHCGQPETTEHYLLLCRKYTTHRLRLFQRLRELKLDRKINTILSHPDGYPPLAKYVDATERFLQARTWRPPPSQPTTRSTS